MNNFLKINHLNSLRFLNFKFNFPVAIHYLLVNKVSKVLLLSLADKQSGRVIELAEGVESPTRFVLQNQVLERVFSPVPDIPTVVQPLNVVKVEHWVLDSDQWGRLFRLVSHHRHFYFFRVAVCLHLLIGLGYS